MLLDRQPRAADHAPGVLEGAIDDRSWTGLDDMFIEFIPWNLSRFGAAIRTIDGESRTMMEVSLQRVVDEVSTAVLAFGGSFVAFVSCVI